MTSIVTNKLFKIGDFLKYSPIYCETGTAAGASLSRAIRAGFWLCKTVEAYEPFYQEAIKKFGQSQNVRLYFGRSEEMLPIMLRDGFETSNSIIFLDSHPAGPGTAGHDDLMEKGASSEFNQDTILQKEIKALLSHRNDHVVIIDDQRGSDEDNLNYRAMLLEANPNYKFYWYDEQLEDGIFYKDKLLVCIPE